MSTSCPFISVSFTKFLLEHTQENKHKKNIHTDTHTLSFNTHTHTHTHTHRDTHRDLWDTHNTDAQLTQVQQYLLIYIYTVYTSIHRRTCTNAQKGAYSI